MRHAHNAIYFGRIEGRAFSEPIPNSTTYFPGQRFVVALFHLSDHLLGRTVINGVAMGSAKRPFPFFTVATGFGRLVVGSEK